MPARNPGGSGIIGGCSSGKDEPAVTGEAVDSAGAPTDALPNASSELASDSNEVATGVERDALAEAGAETLARTDAGPNSLGPADAVVAASPSSSAAQTLAPRYWPVAATRRSKELVRVQGCMADGRTDMRFAIPIPVQWPTTQRRHATASATANDVREQFPDEQTGRCSADTVSGADKCGGRDKPDAT